MAKGEKSRLVFLQDASHDQLEAAVAWNHRVWMTIKARVAGGEVHEENGVTWTFTPGRNSEGMILFPRLPEDQADVQLDAIIAFYRDRRPAKLVGCWSLDPPQPGDLGVRLLARGFQLGWRPRWMWLDMRRMRLDHPHPNGLRVEVLDEKASGEVEDLPFYDEESESIRYAATRLRPQRVWRFAAWLDGRLVGHSTLCLTTGALGVAGIYDVGVVPAARNRGIGKAVTIAACLQAQKLGCRHAVLNGTGERMYRQIGFERIGYGMTWWLNVARLEANPPTPAQIAFAEAIGRGDIDALDRLEEQIGPEALDTPLTNGMTPVELAVKLGKAASARWLIDHGATLDVLSAWDLGGKERVAALLAEHPEAVNRRSGEMQATPLHMAIERGDIELVRFLLAANADLNIKDAMFGSTPLGWAYHLQRTDIIELIEAHQARSSRSSPSRSR